MSGVSTNLVDSRDGFLIQYFSIDFARANIKRRFTMNETKADKAYTELRKLIINGFNEVNRRLNNVEERLDNIENDVNTIAKNTDHERDERGQLQKTA